MRVRLFPVRLQRFHRWLLDSHEPFGSHREHFNFLAVAAESRDSGVSVPRNGTWRQTP